MTSRHVIFAAFAAVWAAPLDCPASVIAGPNGVPGGGNITQASLNSFITTNSLPAFPYWGNIVAVSDATGIYLGANNSYGWVLTANHVTAPASITVAGTPYTVHSGQQVGAQDLKLYRIGGEFGDPALPALPNVICAPSTPGLGTGILTFGRAERVEGTAGSAANSDIALAPGTNPSYFEWGGAGSIRWGTNQVELLPPIFGTPSHPLNVGSNQSFISIFHDPGAGNYLTTTESQGAVGDSGGSAFVINAGAWELAGMSFTVGSATGQSTLTNFGDITAYIDISAYKSAISGMMIPEPSAFALGLVCAGICGLRRRRKSIS
jgi:hypothetical protein